MAPAHDKGLSAALGLLDAQGGNQLTLAWSPDGRRLAVSNFAIAQDVGSLIVYDCASGATLQRFTGGQFGSNSKQYGATENPIWSPDSSRLLLTVNGVVAKVVILGPAALGA
jgi:Tol biopolymer transport system component